MHVKSRHYTYRNPLRSIRAQILNRNRHRRYKKSKSLLGQVSMPNVNEPKVNIRAKHKRIKKEEAPEASEVH